MMAVGAHSSARPASIMPPPPSELGLPPGGATARSEAIEQDFNRSANRGSGKALQTAHKSLLTNDVCRLRNA